MNRFISLSATILFTALTVSDSADAQPIPIEFATAMGPVEVCQFTQGPFDLAPARVLATGVSHLRVKGWSTTPSGSDVPLQLNGNNSPDLVAVNSTGHAITVLFDSSIVGYRYQVTVPVGNNPKDVQAGDLDNDGIVDLVTTNSGNVSLLFNRGDRTFNSAINLTAGIQTGTPGPMALGDFDSDGDLDIAVMDGTAGLATFKNIGSRNFVAGPNFGIFFVSPLSLHVAHLNGDSKIDLVLTNFVDEFFPITESVNVIRNQTSIGGNFSFTTSAPDAYQFYQPSNSAAIGDINGDGRIDISALDNTARAVKRLRNNANNFTFTLLSAVPTAATTAPKEIIRADLDLGNGVELITANNSGNDISVLVNDGAGNFAAARKFNGGRVQNGVTTSDIDADGDLDLLTSSTTAGIQVYENLRQSLVCR